MNHRYISLLLVIVLLFGGSSLSAKPLVDDQKAEHLINRLSFGPKPGDLETVRAKGIESYIKSQLNPQSLPESEEVATFVKSSPALTLSAPELVAQYGPPAIKAQANSMALEDGGDKGKLTQEIRRNFFKSIYGDISKAKMLRALKSPRQLQEVMTDFWFNHFNIFGRKGLDNILVGAYEQQAIRPYVFGKFRNLLGATCEHPAMLFYLDNVRNQVLKGKEASKADGSNENYARELMELHTLGVDGGYTQKDVTELARILTGLGIPNFARPNQLSVRDGDGNSEFGAYFNAKRHDFGDKVLLGHTIKGTGSDEIVEALDILARHPATAHHICYKLAQYFVSDTPPAPLVTRLAARFTKTDGDIKVVLNDLFHSPEFWDKSNQKSKFKSPLRYVISTLRVLDADPSNYEPLLGFLRNQGMPIYGCLTPDGFKSTTEAWLSPDSILRRINFSSALALGQRPGIYAGPADPKELTAILGNELSGKTLSVIEKSPEPLKAALILGSPEFMKY